MDSHREPDYVAGSQFPDLAQRTIAYYNHGPYMISIQTLAILAQAEAPAPSPIATFMPLIFIGVIFYFLLIRPQQKRQKEHRALVASLKTGDSVLTNAGIYGLISNVKETTVTVKVADNVKIEFAKDAIATVIKPSDGE